VAKEKLTITSLNSDNFKVALDGLKKLEDYLDDLEKKEKAAKEKFNRDLYNFDNLIKNPDLLKKLDLIDKLVDNSK
jgi:hypothetical protein